jgi:tRNA-specific 2-thiouridylase
VCNRQVRWSFLLERALALGADYMATGHYARVQSDENGRFSLLKAIDLGKDQSYVLHVLDQSRLSRALFPLGQFTKPQVRELARQFGLPTADRPESQDLCFLGSGDYRSFLLRNAPQVSQPGPILSSEGQILGEHQGLAFYTIGQRKGLGIPSSEPLYVIDKDISRNALVVGPQIMLGSQRLVAGRFNWITGTSPVNPFRAQVKIRYKSQDAWATVTPLRDTQVDIFFDDSIRDITPGQAAVIYNGDVCLGGGIIQSNTG